MAPIEKATGLEAAAASASGGFRIDAARAHALAGRALAERDRREEAVTELRSGYDELDAVGAIRYRDEAARALRRLGVRIPRSGQRGEATTGVSSLSQREREVAELVAEGRTNREIAAVLFISEKTVEKRLSRVFEKLGISGRAAVGARLTEAADR